MRATPQIEAIKRIDKSPVHAQEQNPHKLRFQILRQKSEARRDQATGKMTGDNVALGTFWPERGAIYQCCKNANYRAAEFPSPGEQPPAVII